MLAKIETPRVANVLLRQRLFKLLDKARKKPITWINAPAGSGKTTLVASYLTSCQLSHIWYQLDEGDSDPASFFYHLREASKSVNHTTADLPLLTPEYLSGIAMFTRNFFRDLYSRFAAPAVLILDNYQDVPKEAMLHEILATAFMEIPKEIAVIIISRESPPAAYARLQAHSDIQIMDWNQIKLTRAEVEDIVATRSGQFLNTQHTEDLYLKTDGWITGLILLLEHAERLPQKTAPEIGEHGLLFDYFAEEIFNITDHQTQQFLLYTAILPKFTLQMADALVGEPNSAGIINSLSSKNYFIYAHKGEPVSFEYHPLFRAFLKTLGLTCLPEAERSTLHERAMTLLEDEGDIDAAVLLGKEIKNWPAVEKLITLQAGNLVQQGRYSTLREWISYLPSQSIDSNTWLRYWRAVTMTFENPLAARSILEEVYVGFSAEKNNTGCALAWTSIVDTYLVCWSEFKSLDSWLDVIQNHAEEIEECLSKEILDRFSSAMFIAYLYRRPESENMQIWAEKVWKIFLYTDNSQLRLYIGPHLILYFMWWVGDLAKAKTLVDAISIKPKQESADNFQNLLLHATETALAGMLMEIDNGMLVADAGLKLAEDSGIHIWDLFIAAQATLCALSVGNLTKGAQYLNILKHGLMSHRYVDIALYSYYQGWYQYLLGEKQQALALLKQSREIIDQSGVYFFSGIIYSELAKVLAELGDTSQGITLTDQALEMGKKMHSDAMQYHAWLAKAEINLLRKDFKQAQDAISQLFSIGRKHQVTNHAWWDNVKMVKLCSLGLEYGIETEYINTIIRKRNLVPDLPSAELENWPWPIKIYTLGRFSLVKDDTSISFSGKAQKKPLELLKALIALGGREVCESMLAEAVWPDAEGDLAHQNLKITIHRLRKLLHQDALYWQEGKLTLNPHACWVDVWSLERQVNIMLAHLPISSPELQQQIDIVLASYHGPFLQGEEHSCILGMRERLRSKVLRLITQVADQLYANGDYSLAIGYYLKGLELEILAESFYQGLMRCYHQLGRIAEGLTTYHRCRTVFKTMLDIEPSAETTALAKVLNTTAL